jgi:hypothetical protein
MLGSSRVAAQLAASREGLGSMRVSEALFRRTLILMENYQLLTFYYTNKLEGRDIRTANF